jgi:ABC-type spermidine/putrescine transport system permease subunit I
MNARTGKSVGSLLLVTVAALYFIPLLCWTVSIGLTSESKSLPSGLPLAILLYRTTLISGIGAFLSVLIAFPMTLVWRFSNQALQRTLVSLMVIPLIMGLLARNYSWIGMLSSSALIPSMGWIVLGGPEIIYTLSSVCLVMTCVFVPISFFMLIQGVSSVSHDHVDAARALGVPDWKIVFVVFFPLTRRAAVLAFGFVFAMAAGFFITPRMIGGGRYDFVSNAILMYVNLGLFGNASTVGLVFLAFMLVPTVLIIYGAIRLRVRVMGR